jgi:hypothetical protein
MTAVDPYGTPRPPSAAARWARDNDLRAARAELRLAKLGVPVALLVAFVLVQTGMGAFLLRTFFGMWLHELGHAAAAWFCGFFAIPGPWRTFVGESRSFLFALSLAGGLGYAAWRAWEAEDRVVVTAAGVALFVLAFGTVLLPQASAQTLITFGGDAGSLVFGAALMATFFAPPGHKLHRDWLRWGFLVIGAGSFADVFSVWWTARHDHSVIPFGELSGCGDSDPSKLVDGGWSVEGMVGRYVALGLVSLAVLFTLQFFHVRRTRAALQELE